MLCSTEKTQALFFPEAPTALRLSLALGKVWFLLVCVVVYLFAVVCFVCLFGFTWVSPNVALADLQLVI